MFQKIKQVALKHKKRIIISLAAFIFLVSITAGPVFVSALMEVNGQRTAEIIAKNTAIEQAIINNDYATWRNLETDNNIKAKVNVNNFPQYVQAYRLLQAGKIEEANLIKEQLNLRNRIASNFGTTSQLDSAIRSRDYNLWRSIVGSQDLTVTAANFDSFAKSYELIEAGKIQRANTYFKFLGFRANPYLSSR